LIIGVGSGEAATCFVPTVSYPTIQSAVDDLTCTTIEVAAGFYMEDVVIARPLTLNGPNAGTSWTLQAATPAF
jgi:hypothetical protein